MARISAGGSSSTSSSLNALYGAGSGMGISGLASGVDTDSLIEAMTSSTRAKIGKQQQKRQSLVWEMDAIQTINSKLLGITEKYTSYASKTNLSNSSLFKSMSVTALGYNSSRVEVTGTSSSAVDFSILSMQMAKNSTLTSTSNVGDTSFSTDSLPVDAAGNIQNFDINQLDGGSMSVTYDGKSYTVKFPSNLTTTNPADADAEQLLKLALASVKVSDTGTDTLADKITVGKDSSGKLTLETVDADKDLTINSGTGDTLKALGLKAGAKNKDDDGNQASIVGEEAPSVIRTVTPAELEGKQLTFSYNGTSKTITLGSGINTIDDLKDSIQDGLNKAFGKDRVQVSASGGKLSFTGDNNSAIVKLVGGDADLVGDKKWLGISSGSNRLDMNVSLKDSNFAGGLSPEADGKYHLKINDEEFVFTGDEQLGSVVAKINSSDAGVSIKYSESSNRFMMESTIEGAAGTITVEGSNLAEAMFGSGAAPGSTLSGTTGQDAKITVKYSNGTTQEIERSNNVFDIDGLTIKAKSEFNAVNADGTVNEDEAITFDASVDTEKITDIVKTMVDDFNELIKYVNDELSAKPDRDYPPLTDEQKKDMTEKEIADWEAKAKKGILFSDSDIRSLTSDLRFIFSSGVAGVGNFKDIGITTSTDPYDNGKLVFDENVFKQALQENPDIVEKMFTSESTAGDTGSIKYGTSTAGIAERLSTTISKYARTMGASKGILMDRAGEKDKISATNSSSNKQVKDIDEYIKKLKATLKSEQDRYQRQFTNMEQMISQMNSQASWLSQQA